MRGIRVIHGAARTALRSGYSWALSVERLPVVVVLDNIRSLYNTGAIFRTADACWVERLVLCGITPRPDQGPRQLRGIAKTALGAETSVPWHYEAEARGAIAQALVAGYHPAVIETTKDATDLYAWMPRWPVCLVFGHETSGVDQTLLQSTPTHVRIPMRGTKESLNVATAVGVVLYELLRKHSLQNPDEARIRVVESNPS